MYGTAFFGSPSHPIDGNVPCEWYWVVVLPAFSSASTTISSISTMCTWGGYTIGEDQERGMNYIFLAYKYTYVYEYKYVSTYIYIYMYIVY